MSSDSVSEPNACTGQLCSWIQKLCLDDVPQEIQTRIKYLILDSLACGFVGAHLPWSTVAANGVFSIEPPGPCSVFGWPKV